MITDWTSERGLAAIEKMDWPEWESWRPRWDEGTLGMVLEPWRMEAAKGGHDYFVGGCPDDARPLLPISNDIALALLRDHAREWLGKQTICVMLDCWTGEWFVERIGVEREGEECLIDGAWEYEGSATLFKDYDLAMIAVVEAAEADHAPR